MQEEDSLHVLPVPTGKKRIPVRVLSCPARISVLFSDMI